MSETCTNDTVEGEKPVQETENVVFPPFPEPTDADFEEDISQEERTYYKNKFPDLNTIKNARLHCSACDRHLGCSAKNENKMRTHPMLRTLVCHTCHTFYNSGEFDKGDDGSELYCRWCGQGGQVYCCSACPHVFCAKCIKRNLGTLKIKEIEDIDDWKCFKCNPKCLWDLRAICWAVLRYCDLKNRIMYKTEDPTLRLKYQEDCQKDYSDCCKSKVVKRKEKSEPKRKDDANKKNASAVAAKLPPTIQVKKFASINVEPVNDKKIQPQKRPASPKNKPYLPKIVKNPITISRHLSPLNMQPPNKRMKVPIAPALSPIRFNNDRKILPVFNTYVRTPRPKAPMIPMIYNGFSNTNNAFNTNNDNINLSIESLTQGLDMSAVAAMAANSSMQDDDVVCTPDLPMEPLCEVTEDLPDDDVECITPVPVAAAKATPPPLPNPSIGPRTINTLPDFTTDNIIQMTENDVTVNAATGGLKFRVDPQTLSANKMYRLPDGRIFAINVNPNMPGGYSATIVAVTDNTTIKPPQKTATYAAKLSAVSTQSSTPPPLKSISRNTPRNKKSKRNSTPKPTKSKRGTETRSRTCDLNVPVEWFRYNLIDAIDALEYSLSRLNQLKKDSSSTFLRSRTVSEMRTVTRSLENLLNTSSTRFVEIKENLNKDLKQYISKKNSDNNTSDDDDVEILPDIENDDPIFIDENSVESNSNGGQEVDLTGLGSSEHDSSEKSIDKHDTLTDSIINDNRRVTRNKSKDVNYAEEDVNDDEHLTKKSPTHKHSSETQDVVAKENGDNAEEHLDEELIKDLDTDNTAAEDNVNNGEDKNNIENHKENVLDDEEMLQEHDEKDDKDKTMNYKKDNANDEKDEENVVDVKENSDEDEENLLDDDDKNKTDDKSIADNNENETEDMSIDDKTLDEDTTSKDVPSESGANEDGILEELLKDDNELNSSDTTENKDSSEMSSENKDS